MRSQPDQPHRDPAEWGRLVESLDAATLFVVIRAWLGPHLLGQITVEDIWQETLGMSWRDREQHEWRGLSAFRSWLLSIAQNRIRDVGRNLARQKRGGGRQTATFSALAGADSVSALLPPRSTTPSRVAGHRERAQAMENALASLQPDLRAVVQLRLFEEVPMRDAAARLGIPLSTAKERLLRGVRLYRSRLHQVLGGDSVVGAPEP